LGTILQMTNYPNDNHGDQLRRVAEDGADMTSAMIIDFTVSAPDERSARAIAALAEKQGFDPSLGDNGGGKPWSVYCSRSMLATHEGVVAAQAQLDALAAGHGGHCEGWATFGNGG